MRSRTLGSTGLSVSELALGTWGLAGQAYGPVPEGESRRVIERAAALGIRVFETASAYAHGRIESELGEVLNHPEDLVVTKWGTDEETQPAQKRFDRDFLRREADASLGRLGATTRVIALLHNPSARSLRDGVCAEVMRELVREGRLASWGVSVSQADAAEAALTAQAPVLGLPYNVFKVNPLRALESKIREQNVGVLAHSVLAYGLLAGRWSPGKEFAWGDHRADRWPDGSLRSRIRHLDAVRPLISGDVTTMRAAALRFALVPEIISSVVIGPRSSAQLDQLLRDAQVEPPYLSEQKLSGLEGRLSHLGLPR